jgi:hypothetical protein
MPSNDGPVESAEPDRHETGGTDEAIPADAADAEGATGGDPIEWGPVRHERLRSVAVGAGMAVAVPVAVGALVVAVFAAETAVTAAAGGTGLGDAWVAIVLLLVGGPFSLVYLLIANDRSTLAARERIRSAVDDYAPPRDAIRLGWVIAGAVLVGAVFAFARRRPT